MHLHGSALEAASRMRAPRRREAASTRDLVAAMEDFMLESAFTQGELHEERLGLYLELADFEDEWDGLVGWEGLQRGKTDASRAEAKRLMAPALHAAIRERRRRVARLTEEIERLERDASKVSRAYTMVGG